MKKYFLLIAFLVVGALIALKFKQGSTEQLSQIVENTENAVNQVATNVTEQVGSAVEVATEKTVDVASQTAETATVMVENAASTTAQVTTDAVNQVKENVAEAAQDAAGKVETIAKNAKSTVNGAAAAVNQVAATISSNLQAELVRDTSGKISKIKVPSIEFEANQAILKDGSRATLSDVAKIILETKEIEKVRIEGYTDNSGNAVANKSLSQQRAEAVSAFLANSGIDKSKLIAKGFGSENPITSNDTANGRSTNRRVEFKVIQ